MAASTVRARCASLGSRRGERPSCARCLCANQSWSSDAISLRSTPLRVSAVPVLETLLGLVWSAATSDDGVVESSCGVGPSLGVVGIVWGDGSKLVLLLPLVV